MGFISMGHLRSAILASLCFGAPTLATVVPRVCFIKNMRIYNNIITIFLDTSATDFKLYMKKQIRKYVKDQ